VSDSPAIFTGAEAAAHHEHPPYQRHHFETYEQQSDTTNFAMWLFLLTEIMFFGGLFTAYLIYRNWYYPAFVAGSHQLNIFWGTLNTLVLITSSFTMAMGVWCAETRKKNGLVFCLILTFILGLGFLGIKTIEYKEKIEKHHVPALTIASSRFSIPIPTKPRRPPATSRWRSIWRATPRSTSRFTS
jgi:cytochrome c oxidase subunit 3